MFYQLMAAVDADAELQERLGLLSPDDYHFTNQSGVSRVDGISDEQDFREVMVGYCNSM